MKRLLVLVLTGGSWLGLGACAREASPPTGAPTPVYNKTTGKLEQLISDRNGDGRPDTWAYMTGPHITKIDIDRNGDGRPDRWEYYSAPPADGSPTIIERADEANGDDGRTITRHERYVGGVLQSVDDDTDGDGRPDKWETYEGGRLARVDMDLTGRGTPTRRLVYGADGTTTRVEVDPDGDGQFAVAPPPAAAGKSEGTR
jgi:hypothetical protein